MLIMHVFCFSLSHENCGCYGNGNSKNVALVGDLCVVGNICACFMQVLSFPKFRILKNFV